jgi:hypothetical protein
VSIENTQDPGSVELTGMLMLATGDASAAIEAQERAGQTQLVHSDRLPTDLRSPREEFEAVGFAFGEPDSRDPMFAPATLPDGWKREGSDHAMWSYILDQYGRRRASIFYKAAFYDRSAHMGLINVSGYVRECAYQGTPIVTDDTWATREEVAKAAAAAAAYAEEQRKFWVEHDDTKYVAEYTAERDKYQAIADEYTA